MILKLKRRTASGLAISYKIKYNSVKELKEKLTRERLIDPETKEDIQSILSALQDNESIIIIL